VSKPADAVLAVNWRLYNNGDAPHMRKDRWDASSVSFSKAGLGHMPRLIDLDWVPFADVSFGLSSIFGAWPDHGAVSGIQCEGRIMSRSGLWWQHTVVATADSRAFI
jgi:hypothetical protein